jgi:argininosuccinate lyase
VVALAEKLGRSLHKLSLQELRGIEPKFAADVHRIFDMKHALGRRNVTGAPGTREVARQIKRWRQHLE